MAASSPLLSSSSPAAFSLIFKHKTLHFIPINNSFPQYHTSGEQSFYLKFSRNAKPTKRWKISANLGNYLFSEANPIEKTSQEIVTTGDDGVSNVISGLLLIAFIGLSILTIGVIYIAVTDFLTKREGEKFEKEEAAKKKRSGKKGKVRARARNGPRGFGQKIEEDDVMDED